MGTDSQQLFGVGLGMKASNRARGPQRFALQRRHPDGERWIELRRFAAREDAEAAMEELVRSGDGETYRVQRVG